jgi:hypothetical protein
MSVFISLMKRLILKLAVALLTFILSLIVTWLTAWFADEPKHNEAKTIRHIQEILAARFKHQKVRGYQADLKTLGRAGLLDRELASGEKDGYFFIMEPFPGSTDVPAMYEVYARPKSGLTGRHTFYANELGVVFQLANVESPQITFTSRVPKNGFPLQ